MWWSMLACTGPEPEPETLICNGRTELCDKRLDEVVLAVAHNAMSAEDEGWLGPNQHYGYETQVADGIRGFMLDVHDQSGVPTLCHGSCSFGSQALADGLARFSALLDAYPSDVFVFIIQDEMEASPIASIFEASGLLDRVIVHDPGDAWPTLGELVAAGTRLLVTHEQGRPDAPDWYHPTYALAWDNDYAAKSVEDFDCAVLRGDRANPLFLLNHFLTNPLASAALAEQANPAEVILEHVQRCEAETGDQVNWLAVDFYDIGGVIAVVDELNAR